MAALPGRRAVSFELPKLDRVGYEQMLADLIRRIPQHTRLWTDFNASDPGITLLQLLCWIDESLLYQANAIPLQTQQNFLRWVLGLAFATNETDYSRAAVDQHDQAFLALRAVLAAVEQGAPLSAADLQRAVVSYLHHPYLALSARAVEALARETNLVIAAQAQQAATTVMSSPPPAALYVRRAAARVADQATTVHLLSSAQWQYRLPPYPNQQQYASSATTRRKLLLADPQDVRGAESTLVHQVRDYLGPRVLAGSAVDVQMAQWTAIDLSVLVQVAPGLRLDVTLTALTVALFQYFLVDRLAPPAAAAAVRARVQGTAGAGLGPGAGDVGGAGAGGNLNAAAAGAPLPLPEAAYAWQYDAAPDLAQIEQLVRAVPGVTAIVDSSLRHAPTIELDRLAQLGANTLLASLPPGAPAQIYRGWPRLRCLDVTITTAAGLPS
ncbi:Uncharacterised protein [Delftia tsuruhatensis]|nr:Uncharacterised protein [Delftia tsuruhatensis]CAC9682834.1 Uncharacterised protein [Delftia tsuruhatensis]